MIPLLATAQLLALAAAAVGAGQPWQVALASCLLTEAILVVAVTGHGTRL